MKFFNLSKSFTEQLTLTMVLLLLLGIGCQKEDSYFEGKAKVATSVDTLMFDTVFTAIGSATRSIKIFNQEKSPILIDVSLRNTVNSMFRINVDGTKGPSVKDVEIQPGDSIYVFVEVTVNPNTPSSISPFVIEELLDITQQGNQQEVLITAWGQNANYISQGGQIALLSCKLQSITFSDPKPYVIYGVLLIDSCSLVLPKGTRLHIHGGIAQTENKDYYNDGQIIVLSKGNIIANGTTEQPVTIQGDRLEKEYEEESGQWGGIRLFTGSKGNQFNNVILKNSIAGIVVDSAAELNIKNSIIKNTAASGLIGIHSTINGENLLLYNNGGNGIQLVYGGNYDFKYTTIASYNGKNEALFANNKRCLDLERDITCSSLVAVNKLKLSMTNCIIAGSSKDEISLDDFTKDTNIDFEYNLKNCLVTVDELLLPARYPQFFNNCPDCYNFKRNDKLFLAQIKDDYSLDTMSVALDRGIVIPTIAKDILGKNRDGSKPDLGCYEFK